MTSQKSRARHPVHSIFARPKTTQRLMLVIVAGLVFHAASVCPIAFGQNIGITTPLVGASDSYFENIGINWGFSVPGRGNVYGLGPNGLTPNIGFSWGGGNLFPPFGGYNPNAGGRLTVNGGNFSFGLTMAKGSTRTLTSQAPSIMTQNGFGGSLFSGRISPFVTGVIPIVGEQPIDNAVTRALESGQLDLTYRPEETPSSTGEDIEYHHAPSSATRGDQSVAAIKAQRAKRLAARKQQCQDKLAEAKKKLELGEKGLAVLRLQEALRLTDDAELKKVIQTQINSLRPARKKD